MTETINPKLGVVVDDDEDVRRALVRFFQAHEIDAVGFRTGEQFIAFCEEWQVEWAVVDVHLTGISGFDIARQLKDRVPPIKIVLMTGNHRPGNAEAAQEAGAICYLTKPIASLPDLLALLVG